jgi:hypothetical protein
MTRIICWDKTQLSTRSVSPRWGGAESDLTKFTPSVVIFYFSRFIFTLQTPADRFQQQTNRMGVTLHTLLHKRNCEYEIGHESAYRSREYFHTVRKPFVLNTQWHSF